MGALQGKVPCSGGIGVEVAGSWFDRIYIPACYLPRWQILWQMSKQCMYLIPLGQTPISLPLCSSWDRSEIHWRGRPRRKRSSGDSSLLSPRLATSHNFCANLLLSRCCWDVRHWGFDTDLLCFHPRTIFHSCSIFCWPTYHMLMQMFNHFANTFKQVEIVNWVDWVDAQRWNESKFWFSMYHEFDKTI